MTDKRRYNITEMANVFHSERRKKNAHLHHNYCPFIATEWAKK